MPYENGFATEQASQSRLGDFEPPSTEELAEQFPRLEILELLGKGGMGAVYKARQKDLHREIALKILPPGIGQDPAFTERFTREAQSMARLSHPNIVTVHDFGQTDSGLYYFLMEFIEGTDLRRLMQTEKLAPAQALAIVPQICDALQYAHEKGIVHRDIKPENILLDTAGTVKITDFGLARLLNQPAAIYTLTADGQRMGTVHYMAPEQVEHPHQVDHRADIYSLGVVFYEMLTGELPLGRFPEPSKKVRVDVRLDQIVLRSLEKEPERRYQYVSDVKTELQTVSSVSEPPAKNVAARSEATTDLETIKSQLRIPGIGLIVAGCLNCLGLIGLILFPLYLRFSDSVSGIPGIWEILIISGGVLPGIITIFGAVSMMRVPSYGLAVTGCILAMLPCTPAFLVGLAFGIWALVVLNRAEVRGAFAAARGAEDGKAMSSGGKVLLTILIVFLLLLPVFACGGILLTWFTYVPASRTEAIRQREEEIQARQAEIEAQRRFATPSGRSDYLEWTSEGPQLTDQCTAAIGLEATEAEQIEQILTDAYRQYSKLQTENMTLQRSGQTARAIIEPFSTEAENLFGRLWDRVDAVLSGPLDESKRQGARKHLPFKPLFGDFGFGRARATILITKTGDGRFRHSIEVKDDSSSSTKRGISRELSPDL